MVSEVDHASGSVRKTVSRALSALRANKPLRFEGTMQRRVALLDRRALLELDT